MTEEPQQIRTIASEEAQRHKDDINAAVDTAVRRIRKLPSFDTLVDDMIRMAVRRVIGDYRHNTNVAMKRDLGGYGGPAKVMAGKAASDVAANCYAYFIGGRTLGSIRGKELPEIAEAEAARAEGHQFNAHLCKRLVPLVPKDKTVRQAVKAGKLRTIFKSIGGEGKKRVA